MAVIAFIGLGQMGSPMASNLLKQGHQLSVFDVNPDAVQRLVDKGAQPASSPAQATIGAEFVITMLPTAIWFVPFCLASKAFVKPFPVKRWSLICPLFIRCKPIS